MTDVVLAIASFAFVAAFTPGPNNVMLAGPAANFGFVLSIPPMLVVGFWCLLGACLGICP